MKNQRFSRMLLATDGSSHAEAFGVAAWFGSVTHELLRDTHRPVLVAERL